MNKQEKLAGKKLKELSERDLEEVSLQVTLNFVKRYKREPNDKELLDCIKKAEKIVIAGWKMIEKNPKKYLKWAKEKPSKKGVNEEK